MAAPESANNSAAQAAFIPLLTLGIPSNVVMAMLLGALIIHGLTPGPLLLSQHPELFWGVVASMYVGNAMLLALNLPLNWYLGKTFKSSLCYSFPHYYSFLFNWLIFDKQ